MIPKKDLVHGAYYVGECRNADLARWDAELNVFLHWRNKFGDRFIEDIKHPEDERLYDVFVPEQRVEMQDIMEHDEIPMGANI